MTKNNKNIRVGIYLCDCDGKISQNIDLDKVKNIIQSEADFEYIRLTKALCGRIEKEKLAKEIDKYSLNRLLIAGCTDPFICRQFLKVAEEAGMTPYNLEFVDLSAVKGGNDGAIQTINNTLEKIKLHGDICIEEIQVTPEIMVVGCGKEGAQAALAIARNQPVIMVEGDPEVADGIPLVRGKTNINLKAGAKVIGIEGFAGNFTVRLLERDQVIKQRVGGVVIAIEAQPFYDRNKYGGLEPGEHVLPLSQFLASETDFKGKKVTFVLGRADGDSLLSYSKVLKKAIDLKEKGTAEVNVLYDDMKVAADRLEQDYELARHQGVNFLKYVGEPQFSATVVAATVQYAEPFLAGLEPLRVTSDMLVLAEDYLPSPVTGELAEALEVRLGPGGFFQDDNAHFLPVKSNREGIYYVGSCHGPIYGLELEREIAEVVAEVGRFAGGKVKVATLQPRVDPEKCAVCLTCYRSCPHKAIEIVHDESFNNMYHSAAQMNPLACRHCGTCAAECPGKAIQLPYYSDQEILQQVTAPPKIVAYACENSGFLAAEYARKLEPELQEKLEIVPVPCSGKIDALYLMKALERGADGVLLLVCHKGNCKYVWGNDRAEKRKEQVRKRLAAVGLEGERVEVTHIAANQGNQFIDAVRSLAERIKQLGTYAGKVIK